MEIREIESAERHAVSVPVQAYAFQPSPTTDELVQRLKEVQRYYTGNVTLVAEEDGMAVAEGSAIPMQQNVRGGVYPMAGIAGVATQPLARRRGHVRALLMELLGRMRDTGCALSALYPFRPSFYERFGYVGLPKARTVTFAPADLAGLMRKELPGEVSWERSGSGYHRYRDFTSRLLTECHGFALLPEYRTVQLRDADDRWLAAAWADGEMLAAATYRISQHGGDLIADDLLVRSPLGRALLLQFFARHVDQVSRVVAAVPTWEIPELWATDLAAVTQAAISFPVAPAPMARVLSLEALAGAPGGRGTRLRLGTMGSRAARGAVRSRTAGYGRDGVRAARPPGSDMRAGSHRISVALAVVMPIWCPADRPPRCPAGRDHQTRPGRTCRTTPRPGPAG